MPSVVKIGDNYKIWFLGSDNEYIAMNDDGIHASSDWIQWKVGSANLYPPTNPSPTPSPVPGLPATGGGDNNISWSTIIVGFIFVSFFLYFSIRKRIV